MNRSSQRHPLSNLFRPIFALSALVLIATGCASKAPLPTPEKVDLQRFMGPWFVIAYTPIVVDKEAYNGVEHYYLAEDGAILTTYQFNKGSFNGPLKTYTPLGRVANEDSNAEWKMQFIWPINADYVILHVDKDYTETLVVHPNRRYAWVMSRKPEIDEKTLARLEGILVENGFSKEDLRRMPQDWSEANTRFQEILKLGASAPLAPR